MAQQDMLKRYLDAGVAFTQMTRDRAEAIVKDLVKAGEVRRKDAERRVDELVERSRENTEQLVSLVRREFDEQLRSLREEVGRLEARLRGDDPPPRSGATAPGAGSGAAQDTPAAVEATGAKKAAATKKARPATASKAAAPAAPAAPAKKSAAGATKATTKATKATKAAPGTGAAPAKKAAKAAKKSS